MKLRNLRFVPIVLAFGLSLAGCTERMHGRMGPWTSESLWASCKCTGDTAQDKAWWGARERNINFPTAGDCGGKTFDDRNAFCSTNCSAAGSTGGEYIMCLK